jgi:hypothetical protein
MCVGPSGPIDAHELDPDGPVLAGGLFLGMLAFLEAGRRIGRRRIASVGAESGFGAVESAIFG